MKCFDVVNTVLDATYEEVPEEAAGRDAAIAQALDRTRKTYGTLMDNGGPDFSDPATRFGYVFSYVPAHAHWIYDLIDRSDEAKAIFASDKARVTCLGGGPGSDVVGVLKYLDEADIECKLFIEIIDGCEDWKATWSDLAFQLDWDEPLHTDYVIHDVAKPKSWSSPTKIAKADIISLSFFISEVYHLDPRPYFAEMLGRAKSGALVLVIDNRTCEVWELIDQLAKEQGFETLYAWDGTEKIYDSNERSEVLAHYAEKFSARSKLTGRIFKRIYRKATQGGGELFRGVVGDVTTTRI